MRIVSFFLRPKALFSADLIYKVNFLRNDQMEVFDEGLKRQITCRMFFVIEVVRFKMVGI